MAIQVTGLESVYLSGSGDQGGVERENKAGVCIGLVYPWLLSGVAQGLELQLFCFSPLPQPL